MANIYKKGSKRKAAAALCIAITMALSGCDASGSRKSMDVMNDRLKNFNNALNKLDYEAVRSLSDWAEGEGDYTAIEVLLDTSAYADTAGEGFVSCTEYIASTIRIKYDIKTVHIDGEQATLDVKYEMVDWEEVYQKAHGSFDEVLEDLKNCPDTITSDAVIVFENVNKKEDWRLCRINDLGKVMSFVHTLPDISDQ